MSGQPVAQPGGVATHQPELDEERARRAQERMLHKHAQRSTPLSGGGLLELRAGRHRGHFGLAPECISGLVVLIVARHWVRIHRWTVVASATGSAALALSRPSSSAAAEGSTRSRIVM